MTPRNNMALLTIKCLWMEFYLTQKKNWKRKEVILSYSFVSEAGNFVEELSVQGLSKRYEPDIPSTNFQ